ncbi:aspartyl-tRNA(Asn)/glutamyl-tRNA(Gln) amidotransferase subunit A [Ketogulonicigenium robustum]|uniref:Aspartyl-tRNA(Asn)/glutamyl-tRNA(Gln) amidotransferase subunit A n=1 Tax=Ketogulonicigenium robustum TaxID=92947 RepID=A0A1W6P2S0_9RHOB|nr:amidase family protein [Ketogulonicigenium robustum]ARO15729.1 aspartyl-tRNA(Asn)/glutamyl-tRNA(Gln) amidotransferase subunit A [Ketogulonicigenium robustum]
MENWLFATAADLGRAIGTGRIDPVALAECYLDAIAAHPKAAHIYARTHPARTKAEAEAARTRARAGNRRSLLDGVPVSWKDLIDSKDIATEAGTALMEGRIPTEDAAILRDGTKAGLVFLGKTHLSEIAFSGLGYNPVTATAPNVHGDDLAPGGSSSGAAASLAFGLAAGAIGSDTGGSIRLPSAWQGLVGFKPAHGAHSLDGVVPLCRRFDTIGPLARSVEDAMLLDAALGGAQVDLADASLQGVRLAVLDTVVGDDLDPAVADATDRAIARLGQAGASITRLSLPAVASAYPLAALLYAPEAWAFWRDYITPAPEKMFAQIYERVAAGQQVPAPDYIAAWDDLHALRRTYAAETAGFDAILCPAAPIVAPSVSRLIADDDYYKKVNLMALRNTRLANLFGLASVNLPLDTPMTGLLLNALPQDQGKVLRIAAAAERALA